MVPQRRGARKENVVWGTGQVASKSYLAKNQFPRTRAFTELTKTHTGRRWLHDMGQHKSMIDERWGTFQWVLLVLQVTNPPHRSSGYSWFHCGCLSGFVARYPRTRPISRITMSHHVRGWSFRILFPRTQGCKFCFLFSRTKTANLALVLWVSSVNWSGDSTLHATGPKVKRSQHETNKQVRWEFTVVNRVYIVVWDNMTSRLTCCVLYSQKYNLYWDLQ